MPNQPTKAGAGRPGKHRRSGRADGNPTAGRRRGLAAGAALLGVALGGVLIALSLITVAGGGGTGPPAGVVGERRALGPVDAPVQIRVYFDFQCGFCEVLHREAEAKIIERYVATGQAHLEVIPLAFLGPDSVRAAEAVSCAADQGRYWEYRDALFTAWRRSGPTAYSERGLLEAAGKVGLDEQTLGDCLRSRARLPEVEADLAQARALGVRVVPVTFINGQMIEGAVPFETFERIIEEVLAR